MAAAVGARFFFIYKKAFKNIARIRNLRIYTLFFWGRIFVRIRIRPRNYTDFQP